MGKKPKPQPPAPPTVTQSFTAFIKKRWKLVSAIGGAIILAGGVNKTINENEEFIERNWPATHGWVILAQQPTRDILRDMQIDNTQGKLDANNAQLNDYVLKQAIPQYQNDPNIKAMLDKNVRDTKATIENLNKQLRTLNQLKEQGK